MTQASPLERGFGVEAYAHYKQLIFSELFPRMSHFFELLFFLICYKSLALSMGFSSFEFRYEACEGLCKLFYF